MKTDGNKWWVTGLADGESSFTIQVYRKSANHSWTVRFCWVMALRSDDAGTLTKVQAVTGGALSETRNKGGNPKTVLQVFRHEDLERLIDHFTKYPLQSKKARDFQVWARAFREWVDSPRVVRGKCANARPAEVVDKMIRYKDRLSQIRRFS